MTMSDLFKYTIPSHNAQTSKITGELLENLNYSKLGALPLDSKVGNKVVRITSAAARISQEGLKYIQDDWEEVALDFTQLGLTLVGLIEVAEPIQMTADVANGAIDIKRGNPIIGAISMFSATPLAGLIGGIPLAVVRAFKCVISGLKFLGKSFIAFAVKPVCAVGKFIWLKRGVLMNYSNKLKKFVENSVTKTIEGIPKITEALIKQIKELGEKLAKENVDLVMTPSTQRPVNATSSLEQSLKTPFSHPAAEARKAIGKYTTFPNTYVNMGKTNLWPHLGY